MIREAVQYLVGLGEREPHFHKLGELEFSDKKLEPVQAPTVSIFPVTTLSGLLALADSGLERFDAALALLHIVNFQSVRLVSKESDQWARRIIYAKAEPETITAFSFGSFMDHEAFVIGLQSRFEDTPDRDYLLKLASSLTTERVSTSQDDGISQTLGQKAGVALVSSITAKSRVSLAPFRTFPEIAQPISEFVFRAKQQGDGTPQLALFEADGGAWKVEAMKTIAAYLSSKTTIPVIS